MGVAEGKCVIESNWDGGIDMASKRINYVCQQCGHIAPRWMGKCPDCNNWDTFVEEIIEKSVKKQVALTKNKPKTLNSIEAQEESRLISNIGEIDRVLGGGIVPGSLLLVGGDPGIGKSTLLLQISNNICKQYGTVLYVSGEESMLQIKLRASRLKVDCDELLILSENNLEAIVESIKEVKPSFVVIDSIQTMYLSELPSAPGSVGQVRECSAKLMELAKLLNVPIILTGHVTKEGAIAGPKVLEHLVDTVLYFENYKNQQFRILRSVKNRFGSTNEIGVFNMTENGLEEVHNPSELFLSERPLGVSGTVVVCSLEGSRPLLLEIQALVSSTPYGNPRRLCTGIDLNRALLMIAVLDKKIGINLGSEDIYLNIAGGIRSMEPSLDLGMCVAITSAFKNKIVDPATIILGEVGLTGEVRGIVDVQKRVVEAEKLGFKRCILPERNIESLKDINNMELIGVGNVREALEAALE